MIDDIYRQIFDGWWFIKQNVTHHDASSFSRNFNLSSRNLGEKNEQGGFHFIFRSKILWSKLPHKRVAPENEMTAGNLYNKYPLLFEMCL